VLPLLGGDKDAVEQGFRVLKQHAEY